MRRETLQVVNRLRDIAKLLLGESPDAEAARAFLATTEAEYADVFALADAEANATDEVATPGYRIRVENLTTGEVLTEHETPLVTTVKTGPTLLLVGSEARPDWTALAATVAELAD